MNFHCMMLLCAPVYTRGDSIRRRRLAFLRVDYPIDDEQVQP